MAKIILEPNEAFEHFHGETSFTILIEGEAKCLIEGVETMLEINQPLLIPAGKSHTMENIGTQMCVLMCLRHM